MKRKLLFILFLVLLVGCAGSQTTLKPTEQKVMTYEGVGLALASSQQILASYEIQGVLKGEDLVRAKLIYGQARAAFLEAGNNMILAIEAPNISQQAAKQKLYAQALVKATQLAIQLGTLLKK